ncbi:MAG: hypothetical protein JXR76_15790 [Deltaproteobacteria bacterium]|nr:hypothetical protein [Deltaproteobacteria bacterium]
MKVVLFVVSMFFLFGCGQYQGTLLSPESPRIFNGCASDSVVDKRERSYNALMASLAHDGWVVRSSNRDLSIISARMCKEGYRRGDMLKKPAEKCLDMNFEVSISGNIAAYNPRKRRFYKPIEFYVKGWIVDLESVFSKIRCFSNEELSRWSVRSLR